MSEDKFVIALDHLREDCEEATHYLYAYIAIYRVMDESAEIYGAINHEARYWRTILAGLQTAKFIALGRIFDSNGHYGLIDVIRMASRNMAMFDKDALKLRKLLQLKHAPSFVDQYVDDAYVPGQKDLDRLMRYATKYKAVYLHRCRDIRSNIFAHNIVTSPDKISKLFSNTTYRHLARLLVFVDSMHKLLFELFYNGRLIPLRLNQPNRVPDSILSDGYAYPNYIGSKIVGSTKQFLYHYLADQSKNFQ